MQKTPLKIIFISTWKDNPYKKLLIDSLVSQGMQVEEISWHKIFIHKVISFNEPCIIHLHTLHPFVRGNNFLARLINFSLFALQLILLKIIGFKIVWTAHELFNKFKTGDYYIPSIYRYFIGQLLDAIIVHGESIEKAISQSFYVKEDKLFLIYHGNYIDFYENNLDENQAGKIFNIPEDSCVLLLFGTIYRYKGFLEAIQAFKNINHQKSFLLIAGQPAEAEIKDLIEQEIKGCKNIFFKPERIPDSKVQIYLNACDTAVIPYQIFTNSGIALLVMSFARACIAPRSGFFQDILDTNGSILYNPNDQKGLEQAMEYAIKNKIELMKMGQHNFQRAKQWSWDYVAQETAKVYQYCISH